MDTIKRDKEIIEMGHLIASMPASFKILMTDFIRLLAQDTAFYETYKAKTTERGAPLDPEDLRTLIDNWVPVPGSVA